MSIVDKKFDEICNAYADYRDNRADFPEYFILGIKARQAIKLQLHPDSPRRFEELKELFGVPIIKLEKAVIVE